MIVVVSQPMFLPWIGLFEQARLADVFVHYDDVQLPQGRSFTTRVQVRTATGMSWLSAPVDHARSGRNINEANYLPAAAWREKHLRSLRHAYARAPHSAVMMALAEEIYAWPGDGVAGFNQNAFETLASWLGLKPRFLRASELDCPGRSTERLVALCQQLGASIYVTGLGALEYLDHDQFERQGIGVRYMDYRKQPYPQVHGGFTPYVTVLDAIANCGDEARGLLLSGSTDWKECVDGSGKRV